MEDCVSTKTVACGRMLDARNLLDGARVVCDEQCERRRNANVADEISELLSEILTVRGVEACIDEQTLHQAYSALRRYKDNK